MQSTSQVEPSLQTPQSLPPLELAVRLFDHYESTQSVQHYYGLLAIYALCRVAEQGGDAALLQRCVAILNRFPNQISHSHYNFPSYRVGGIPRAWMLFRGHMTDELTRRYVAHYADEMMLASRDEKGLMCNPFQPAAQRVWIDVAMAVTPYLLFAGLALDCVEWVDESVRQAVLHYDEFLNPSNGLLHQCRGFVAPGRFSEDHWGRGNGWGYIALTELVQYLPADHAWRQRVLQRFVALSEALLPHQSPRGLWRQEVPLSSAWEESSATGLFLYGFAVGVRNGVLPRQRYGPAIDRGVAALREYCVNADFSTELCCPGCLCPGEGDRKGTVEAYLERRQPVRDDPHSFAPIMLALCEQAALALGSSTP